MARESRATAIAGDFILFSAVDDGIHGCLGKVNDIYKLYSHHFRHYFPDYIKASSGFQNGMLPRRL